VIGMLLRMREKKRDSGEISQYRRTILETRVLLFEIEFCGQDRVGRGYCQHRYDTEHEAQMLRNELKASSET